MKTEIEKLKKIIDGSDNIVFFGGAGVSTESGVPDFRSPDGLYNTPDVRFDRYTPEYLLSHECFEREPKVFFEFYRQKLDTRSVEPNAAHRCLAKLEQMGKLRAVVTQNIDGLHTRAGSKNVYEIHGTTEKNYCTRCGKRFPAEYIFESKTAVPRCPCGGVVRCDVTLYGESLPEEAVEGAVRAIRQADVLIIGGTSLTVYPAATYVRYFRGSHLVIINREPLSYPLDPSKDIEIIGSIGEVLSSVITL
ncbi:MAG: NAD-dependent protein deacylase [Clostridia bacterium]|nr:NAD-dependent protein deacylase [Clostridia bacterium]